VNKALLSWDGLAEYLVSAGRVPAHRLIRELAKATSLPGSRVRHRLRELVEAGQVCQTWTEGVSFYEPGFLRPLSVGERLVLARPGAGRPDPEKVPVFLPPGAAFGLGRHPTTRLACTLLEKVLGHGGLLPPGLRTTAMDAGCGTGVLGLAALLLGMERAVLVDIDPVAVDEARRNARLNGLDDRADVSGEPLESFAGPYPLILANLRGPTLVRLLPWMERVAPAGGMLVATGTRPGEAASFAARAAGHGFAPVLERTEAGWTGLALARK